MWDKFTVEVNVCKPIFNPIKDPRKAENLNLNNHTMSSSVSFLLNFNVKLERVRSQLKKNYSKVEDGPVF